MIQDGDSERDLIEVLADDFVRRWRDGERPAIEEYASQHPERADEIRELLPTIVALEQMRERKDASDGRVQLNESRPEQLGDYRLLQEIGRGGMGVVYEAEQISLGRRVAVKVLPRQTSPEFARRTRRFEREARTAAQMHHSNIVPVFGVGHHEGYHYIVMQRILGVSLEKVLARYARSESDPQDDTESFSGTASDGWTAASSASQAAADHHRLRIGMPARGSRYWRGIAHNMAEVADALQYAHEQGILHRDIKPGNLLLDAHGVMWIADFGLARALDPAMESHSEDLAGTLRYMAPERFSGQCDATSDVYSLGATLYELITLQPAFRAKERESMIRKITDEGLRPPSQIRSDVPRDLETIVIKATAIAPQDRYRSAADLAADLRRFLADRPVRARRATWPEQAWRWCRRNRAVASAASIALAMLCVACIVSSVAYVRTSESLQRVSAEQRRTARTLELSLEALDKLYGRFAPDELFLSSLPTVDSGEQSGLAAPAQPMLSPQTALLLEELLVFYDRLAEEVGDPSQVNERAIMANRRMGDIQLRLGEYERAREAYDRAIELLNTIDSLSDDLRIEAARLHNSRGNLLFVEQRITESRQDHQWALEHLSEGVAAPLQDAAQYETARAHYLMGRRYRLIGRMTSSRRRGFLRDYDFDPRGHLEQAIQLLEDLCQRSSDPRCRRLLAICYRDADPAPLSDGVDAAIGILDRLCREEPDKLQYVYDLSETLGLPASRQAQLPELELVRLRLLDAIGLSEKLSRVQPNVPLYFESRSHLHRKLADVLLQLDEQEPADAEAEQAIEIQRQLRARYPELATYKVWTAVMIEQRARQRSDEAEAALAYLELTAVIEELSELLKAKPDAPFVAASLSGAYIALARIQMYQNEFPEAMDSLWRSSLLQEAADFQQD